MAEDGIVFLGLRNSVLENVLPGLKGALMPLLFPGVAVMRGFPKWLALVLDEFIMFCFSNVCWGGDGKDDDRTQYYDFLLLDK